jgi:hypothetical protein
VVGNYIAKYVTKSFTVSGLPDRRLNTRTDIDRPACPRHYRQMTTAWASRQVTPPPTCGRAPAAGEQLDR